MAKSQELLLIESVRKVQKRFAISELAGKDENIPNLSWYFNSYDAAGAYDFPEGVGVVIVNAEYGDDLLQTYAVTPGGTVEEEAVVNTIDEEGEVVFSKRFSSLKSFFDEFGLDYGDINSMFRHGELENTELEIIGDVFDIKTTGEDHDRGDRTLQSYAFDLKLDSDEESSRVLAALSELPKGMTARKYTVDTSVRILVQGTVAASRSEALKLTQKALKDAGLGEFITKIEGSKSKKHRGKTTEERMRLRAKKLRESSADGNWRVEEETLSDGSIAYNVVGEGVSLGAANKDEAYRLASALEEMCIGVTVQ